MNGKGKYTDTEKILTVEKECIRKNQEMKLKKNKKIKRSNFFIPIFVGLSI